MEDSENIMESVLERSVRYENLPLVAIAGRPNAGKSTLFNRLLHRRLAITDPTPGVTRDPVEAEFLLPGTDDRRITLVDTGGFKMDREGLDDLVVEKSLATLARADLVIFLVDCTLVTPEDEEFAQYLRRHSAKVLLVVNKADSPERDAQAYSHLRWGFEPVIFISAEHGRNIDLLVEEMLRRLDFSAVRTVDIERADIRLAIMGKPNTGKSTLLNRFLGEERSIVSDIAGTTRDVVEGRFTWKGRGITVLDTAGIRRKSKVSERVEYYSVTRALAVVDRCDIVILMIDAEEGLTDQDKKIIAFAADKGLGIIFALNKWDLMPDMKNTFEASRDRLRFFFGQMAYAPVLPLSAKEGDGVDKLLNMVITVQAQLAKKVPTPEINKAAAGWVESTPPPANPRNRFRLRYACQISIAPQKFAFFITRPEYVPGSYVSYLRNKIREDFGLDKVPVLISLRESRAAGREGAAARIQAAREATPLWERKSKASGTDDGEPDSPARSAESSRTARSGSSVRSSAPSDDRPRSGRAGSDRSPDRSSDRPRTARSGSPEGLRNRSPAGKSGSPHRTGRSSGGPGRSGKPGGTGKPGTRRSGLSRKKD